MKTRTLAHALRWGLVGLCSWPFFSSGQTANNNTLLWEIIHPTTQQSSFLFATAHRNDSVVFQVDAALMSAFKRCDVLALESDPTRWQDPFTIDPLVAYLQPVAKGPATGHLHPATFQLPSYRAAVQQALTQVPALGASWMRYQPGKPNAILDLLLYQFAARIQKPVVELESDESREAAFSTELKRLIPPSVPPNTEEIKLPSTPWETSYDQGNLVGFASATEIPTNLIDQTILAQRNERFVQRILQLLRNKTALMAIGAAHIPGQQGVIAKLEAAGFQVKPLPFQRQVSLLRALKTIPSLVREDSTYRYYQYRFSIRAPGRLYNATGWMPYPIMEYTDIATGQIFVAGRLATAAHLRGYDAAAILQQIKQDVQAVGERNVLYQADTVVKKRLAWRLITRDAFGLWQDRLLVIGRNEVWITGWNGQDEDRSRAETFYRSFEVLPRAAGFEHYANFDALDPTGATEISHVTNVSEDGFTYWQIQHTLGPHLSLTDDTTLLRLAELGWRKGIDIAEVGHARFNSYFNHLVLENDYQTKTGLHWHVRFLRTGPTIWTWIHAINDQKGRRDFDGFPKLMFQAPNALRWRTDSVLRYRIKLTGETTTVKQDADARQALTSGATVFRRLLVMQDELIQLQVRPINPYQTWPDSASFLREQLEQCSPNDGHHIQVIESKPYPKLDQWMVRLQVTKPGSNNAVRYTIWQSGRRIYQLYMNYDTLVRLSDAHWIAFESFQPLPNRSDQNPIISGVHQNLWKDYRSPDSAQAAQASAAMEQLRFTKSDIPYIERAWNQATTKGARQHNREILIQQLARIDTSDKEAIKLLAKWHTQHKRDASIPSAVKLSLAQMASSEASATLWQLDSSLYPTLHGPYASLDWEFFLQRGIPYRIRYIPQLEQDILTTGGRNASWNLLYQLNNAGLLPKATFTKLRATIQARLDTISLRLQSIWNQRRASVWSIAVTCQRNGLPELLQLVAQDEQQRTWMEERIKRASNKEQWWLQVYYYPALWKRNQRMDSIQLQAVRSYELGRLVLEEQLALNQGRDLRATHEQEQREQAKWFILAYSNIPKKPELTWLMDSLIQTSAGMERWHLFRLHRAEANETLLAITQASGKTIDWNNPQIHFLPEETRQNTDSWTAAWYRIMGNRQPHLRYYRDPESYTTPISAR